MRQLLALDYNRRWKTDYGPSRGSHFGFVMCSGQVTEYYPRLTGNR